MVRSGTKGDIPIIQVKKHKPQFFRQMKDDITKIDNQTYYVKGSMPEPYLVFDSIHKGWMCDCLSFVMNLEDSGKCKPCKHIIAVQKHYGLVP